MYINVKSKKKKYSNTSIQSSNKVYINWKEKKNYLVYLLAKSKIKIIVLLSLKQAILNAITRKENKKLPEMLIDKKYQLHVQAPTLIYSCCGTYIVALFSLNSFQANYA